MVMLRPILILLLANSSFGVIYNLNESEYHRMPRIFNLDDYKNCSEESDSVYCTVHFTAVSDEPSELLTTMQEYSAHYTTHYNHTSFHYGVCVTQNCGHLKDQTGVQKEVLEGCLNETFWHQYKLKTKVIKYTCESLDDGRIPIDTSDIIVGLAIFIILAINIAGSLSDVVSCSNFQDNEILQCFSIKRHWKELFSVSGDSTNRPSRLRALNGIKSVIQLFVFICHCFCFCIFTSVNTMDIEKLYHNLFYRILLSSSIAMHAEFFMSAFLLMYKLMRYSEINGTNLSILPKGLFIRCLRILPSYAVVIGITATWLRRIGSGPFWETIVMQAANDCRQHWWLHLLFMNNFVYNSECLPHSWYLAADTQLYILGLLVCACAGTDGARRRSLVLLYIIGIVIPPTITYLLDLEGRIIFSPEKVMVLFKEDPTFREVYVHSYTNIAASALGLMMGDLFYRWQINKVSLDSIKKYETYHFLRWLLPVSLFAMIASGQFFYRDAPRDALYIRVLYSLTAAPLFTILFAIILLAMLFKSDITYRSFWEWKGWIIPSRLSYCAYLVHFPVIRVVAAAKTSLSFMSTPHLMANSFIISVISFALAIPLWLMVEAPFIEIGNLCLTPKQEQKVNKSNIDVNDQKIEDRKND